MVFDDWTCGGFLVSSCGDDKELLLSGRFPVLSPFPLLSLIMFRYFHFYLLVYLDIDTLLRCITVVLHCLQAAAVTVLLAHIPYTAFRIGFSIVPFYIC